jgi:hypothetical protein
MKIATHVRLLAATALLGGVLATSALADTPDARIHFGGAQIAFLGSVHWGSGTLHYHGQQIPLGISGLGIGAIGASRFSAEGDVYNLHNPGDIAGTYTAVEASATAGAGQGEIDMRNEHGVEIRAHTTSQGLSLSLAPTGVVISVK